MVAGVGAGVAVYPDVLVDGLRPDDDRWRGQALANVLDAISELRSNGNVSVVDKRRKFVVPAGSYVIPERADVSLIKYSSVVQEYAAHIVDNLPKYVHDLFVLQRSATNFVSADPIRLPIIWNGLQVSWSSSSLRWLSVDSNWVKSGNLFKNYVYDPNTMSFVLSSHVYRPETTLLFKAYNMAVRSAYRSQFYVVGQTEFSLRHAPSISYGVHEAAQYVVRDRMWDLVKPTAAQIMECRREIMRDMDILQGSNDTVVNAQKFSAYWNDMKQRVSAHVSDSEVAASFASIPLQQPGTSTSRTWGIEVETVNADVVDRPAGWDRRYDGSLESLNGSCNNNSCSCECSDCDDGDHDSCYNDESSDCAEFVSPILTHFNSSGLKSISNVLHGKRTNDSAGVHIHVGADDLTVEDLSRLIRAYSTVSPFIWPLMHRNVKGYCQDVSSSNVAHWLANARNVRRGGQSVYPIHVSQNQPDNRYRDLNLHSLAAHSTVEFRAMGPYYEYKHLVRWAWFCREMVNVSKLDLPQSLWTGVKSMQDVLDILYKYGQEQGVSVDEPAESELSSEGDAEYEAGE